MPALPAPKPLAHYCVQLEALKAQAHCCVRIIEALTAVENSQPELRHLQAKPEQVRMLLAWN